MSGPNANEQPLRPPVLAHPPTNLAPSHAHDLESSWRDSKDLEEGSLGHQSMPPHYSHSLQSHRMMVIHTENGDFVEDDEPRKHRVWTMIYLSFLAPLFALLSCLYSTLATVIILVLGPLYFLATRRPLNGPFYRFLAPPLTFQLGLIFHDAESPTMTNSSNAILLVLVNTCAPVYALGITISAWVVAVFWFYTAVLGNPDGQDGRDDGWEAVLAVRNWWARWLLIGLR
ncbi:hypothetical protein MMC28_005564 [Mycoblastus sanguinarius]|nr:hypothetical protein [Mycoblastus sanguinarius]